MEMTDVMKRALEMHSVVPSTARERSARVDYNMPRDFYDTVIDASQEELIMQSKHILHGSLIFSDYRKGRYEKDFARYQIG